MTVETRQYRTVVTIEPASEPVTLAEAKVHLRVDHDDENTLIESLITAARQWAETETNRRFINTTIRLSLDAFPCEFRLPGGKTQSVTSITYVDGDGTTQTLATSVYTLDSDSEPARIVLAYNQMWPQIRDVPNAVKVLYVAGYGSAASDVPAGIKKAILQHCLHQYTREPEPNVLESAQRLLDPYRIKEFF